MYNNKDNVIKAFEDGIFPFKDGFRQNESDVTDETLSDWVKVDKKRFDWIQTKIKMFKNKNRFVIPGGSGDRINANDSYHLIQDRENGKITHKEALKEIFKIRNDIERLNKLKEINQNQVDMLNILFMTWNFYWNI